MFCHACGKDMPANAQTCPACGAPARPAGGSQVRAPGSAPTGGAPKINNYLVPAILVTIFCCLPLGVPAIVFAAMVNGKVQAGDIQGATDAAKKAKLFSWLAFGLGLVGGILYFILMFIGVLAQQQGM